MFPETPNMTPRGPRILENTRHDTLGDMPEWMRPMTAAELLKESSPPDLETWALAESLIADIERKP